MNTSILTCTALLSCTTRVILIFCNTHVVYNRCRIIKSFDVFIFLMPRRDGWMVYDVDPKNKKIVKRYALDNDIQIGHALNKIIEEWAELKKNE